MITAIIFFLSDFHAQRKMLTTTSQTTIPGLAGVEYDQNGDCRNLIPRPLSLLRHFFVGHLATSTMSQISIPESSGFQEVEVPSLFLSLTKQSGCLSLGSDGDRDWDGDSNNVFSPFTGFIQYWSLNPDLDHHHFEKKNCLSVLPLFGTLKEPKSRSMQSLYAPDDFEQTPEHYGAYHNLILFRMPHERGNRCVSESLRF